MNKRMEEILKNMEENALGLDDTFDFKCRCCGKCCKNREDILLTTRDLYNIAQTLGRSIEYVVRRYCEVYIGSDSRVPIIRLNPVGPEMVCPLLHGRKCIVHKAKPTVCALFPLGRAVSFDMTDGKERVAENIRPQYFWQPACGGKGQTQTVREWLTLFGMPVEDEFYGHWNEMVSFLSGFFRDLEAKEVTPATLEMIWNATIQMLYIDYDPAQELISQFRENAAKLKEILSVIKEQAAIFFGGVPNGK